MTSKRLVGVTVLPEYLQSESINAVLDRLQGAGVNAVTTSPYLMEEADEKTGSREPPADAGAGGVRLLDRPLWGKRELYVRTAPSFIPDQRLYEGLRYRPPPPTDLTRKHGLLLPEFIGEAQKRGMKVYLQVQAAIPPGYRVQFGGPQEADQPLLPDGRIAPKRLAKNGSIASAHIREYAHSLIRDLCRNYPSLNGLRFDWPEYPPYFLDSVFLDFGPHAHREARRLGFDFEVMRRDALALYRKLHGGLEDADLQTWIEPDGGRSVLLRLVSDYPGITEWIRFKARLVEELLVGFRESMDSAGGHEMELVPNAFPPPWSIASGMDYERAARHCSAISVKLYTMHWPMILRFYGDALMQANPGLSKPLLTRVLVNWLDIADDEGLPGLDDYRYPAPDESHPVGAAAQRRKIAEAQRETGTVPVYPLAHGYGPVEDFRRRLKIAAEVGAHGFWVNRYGYLSDEKLKVLGEVAHS